MNWIRKDRRLAIYIRDGLACGWCGLTLEDGIILTLDHFLPRVLGGSNESTNLFTSCMDCNRKRCSTPAREFAHIVAGWFDGFSAADILTTIVRQMKRPLDRPAARAILAKRRKFSDAIKHARKVA